MKCGIVGLPNVGKSTLFNCLTRLSVPAENYPFCTVEPNIGRVFVPDARFDYLVKTFKPKKNHPAHMEFVDIAGLIPGAHKGEGLGNLFLSHIREVHAILHVVKGFGLSEQKINDSVFLKDIELIKTELMLADLSTLEKRLAKLKHLSKGKQDLENKTEFSLVEHLIHLLSVETKPLNTYSPKPEERAFLKTLNLLTAKPQIYVLNTDEQTLQNPQSKLLQIMENTFGKEQVLALSAEWEYQLLSLEDESDKTAFLKELGFEESALNRLIAKSYSLLNTITFFTAGKEEVRAWPIQRGTRAPQAAGKIHSDFEKGFIKAEVYSVAQLKAKGSESALKNAGLYRIEGKAYEVRDQDVIFFRFSPAGK